MFDSRLVGPDPSVTTPPAAGRDWDAIDLLLENALAVAAVDTNDVLQILNEVFARVRGVGSIGIKKSIALEIYGEIFETLDKLETFRKRIKRLVRGYEDARLLRDAEAE